MADFYPAITKTLKWEGGLVNDPDDSGGLTNMGITIARFKQYAPSVLGMAGTEANLINLSKQNAIKFYAGTFWKFIQGASIKDQDVANAVFDFSVHSGTTGIKVIQRVLNAMGNNLKVDGIIGPNTLFAINAANPAKLYNNIKQARLDFLNQLAVKRPKDQKFLKGWINRVESFPWKSIGIGAGVVIGLIGVTITILSLNNS